MFFTRETCPHCYKWYRLGILGVSSKLGPSQYLCRHCSQIFNSGCLEWKQMTQLHKIRYILVSLLYIIALTILGGVGLKQGYYYFQQGLNAPNISLDDKTAWIYGIPFGLLTAILQYFRINWSNQRKLKSATEGVIAYPFLWTTNLHFVCLILFLMLSLLGIIFFGIKVVITRFILR